MDARRRSCVNEDGDYIYDEWQCMKCKTWHDNESLAKFCCADDSVGTGIIKAIKSYDDELNTKEVKRWEN
jgi:hypothetical protein